jgi:hypothetical protein
MKKNQFLYWRMENGHEHSYLEFETENILNEYATENQEGILTQEQYIDYIERHEHTDIEEIIIEDFNELTIELAQKWLDNDYVANFEVQENNEPFLEFY